MMLFLISPCIPQYFFDLEVIHIPGKTPIIREVLNKQAELYKCMAVEPPVGALS